MRALLLGALGGCSSEAPPPRPPVERDSAGIHIVESIEPRLTRDSSWSISEQPILEIGSSDEDSTQTLFRVAGVTRLDNGQIVIATGAAPMLRWYDASGRFLHGAGRPGGGPGEFSGEGGFIDGVWAMHGDSVATWDLLQRRLQIFDERGRFVRAATLAPAAAGAGIPMIAGRFANGDVLTTMISSAEPDAGVVIVRDTLVYIRRSANLARADTLRRLPGRAHFAAAYWQPRIAAAVPHVDGPPPPPPPPPPFWPAPVTHVTGDRLYYGSGERFEIAVYDAQGVRTVLIRAYEPRRQVTRAVFDTVVAELTGRLREGSMRDAYRRLIEEAPRPDSLPPYDDFIVDRTGALWVREFRTPGVTSLQWYVFDEAVAGSLGCGCPAYSTCGRSVATTCSPSCATRSMWSSCACIASPAARARRYRSPELAQRAVYAVMIRAIHHPGARA